MTGRAAAGLDAKFVALTDPTRRRVIEALGRGELRAGELAAVVDMTPPALSRHLRVLRRAGLVPSITDRTRTRACGSIDSSPVRSGECAWLDEVEEFWNDELQAFKAHAEGGARSRRGR